MSPARPIRRLLLGVAILVLGLAAWPRLPLTFELGTLFPELRLTLVLPAGQEGQAESQRTRRLSAIENAIRRSGNVEHLAGEVGSERIELRIRYSPAADIETKATLLDSLLGETRRHLPAGAFLTVRPARGRGGAFAFVAQVDRADPALLEAVRRLPGVAAARYSGSPIPELRLELPIGLKGPAATVEAATVAAALQKHRFGRWPKGHGADLATAPPRLEDVWIGDSRLGQLGRLEAIAGEPLLAARVDGRPAELLVVDRDPEASPLALENLLRQELERAGLAGGRFLRDESAPLRLLLRRLGIGLVAASLLLGLLHLLLFSPRAAAWQLLAMPLGLAAALPLLHLLGMSLDVLTLPALFFAVLSAPLPVVLGRRGAPAWGRLVFAVAAVAALPVALALLGQLGVFLGAPARVFLLVLAAAAPVQLLLPPPGEPRPWVATLARRLQVAARRRGGALLLATVVLFYLSWILFAGALWPRAGSLRPDLGDLALTLQLPGQTSFAATTAEVERAETLLATLPEVTSYYALYSRGAARFFLDLEEGQKSRAQLANTGRQIEGNLRQLGLLARAHPLGGSDDAPPLRFDRAEEFRAESDVGTRTHRILLRGRDFADILEAEALLRRQQGATADYLDYEMVPDWRPPERTLELRARKGVGRDLITRAEKALRQIYRQDDAASLVRLPGQSSALRLRLVAPGTPGDLKEPGLDLKEPAIDAVLMALRQPDEDLGRHFELVSTYTPPELHWESGLYVLPLDLDFKGSILAWIDTRNHAQQQLAGVPLPPGTDLVLPRLEGEPWEERLRMLAALALLPVLLLALLAMRLDSFWLALVALLPGAGALAAAAPLLRAHAGGNDEATLLALAAALTGLLPLAAFSANVSRARKEADSGTFTSLWATRGHRELCRVLPRVLPWLLATALVLFFTGAGLDTERQPWVKPQRAAGIALLAGALLALFVSPALQVAAEAGLRSLRPAERQRRRAMSDPPAWREEKGNVLEVRSLSKRYGNGFRALRKVDLRLEPGIVALLGPNGAGKTTLLRTLCGTLEPSRGQVFFRGQPVLPENLPVYRRRVGYLPQSFNAWDGLSAWRFLDYWSDVLGLPEGATRRGDIEKALRSVGLENMAKQAVRQLSGGQRRRLGIARALLGEPPILIVDEPTTGLDVDARNQLRESLVALAGERIVIFSTHIASDIAAVASRVLLLDRGRLLFDGPPEALIAEARGRVFERLLREDELRPMSRRFHLTTRIREPEGIRIRAVTHPGQEPEGDLVEPNLEEAYLARLGQGVRQRDERSWASLLDLEAWRTR